MDKKPISISCIITAHKEGIILHTTLCSYEAMRCYAENQGMDVEWILVLDRSDEETRRVAEKHPALRSSDTLLFTDNGNPAQSRNDGIEKARGNIIAILDGDDYCTKNFLAEAANLAAENRHFIVHPQYILSFGAVTCIHELWDMRSHKEIDAAALVFTHPWSSMVVADRSIFQSIRYVPCSKGFAYEDWHWNCEVIAHGSQHIIASNTVCFYRRKMNGVLSSHAGGIMPPSRLFFLSWEKKESAAVWWQRTYARWQHSFYKRLPAYGKKTLSRWKHSLEKRLPNRRPDANKNREEIWKEALLEISHIDPKLHPSRFSFPMEEYVPHLHKDWGSVFCSLCRRLEGEKFDIAYVVPWIIPGGADLMILNHANACARHGKKILVFTTLNERESTWASRLDKNVQFIELGSLISPMPYDIQITFLAKLLLQINPAHIHIINSQLGHETVKKYGRALMQVSNLISTYYNDDIRTDGTLDGYATQYITEEYPFIHTFTSDNSINPKKWCKQYGTDDSKWHITYGKIEQNPIRYANNGNNKVLWAGRICDQKRPDILYHAAKLLPKVEFHVYGARYEDGVADIAAKLEQMPNVVMKGAFSGFQSIPLEQYAALLYTSKSDGLPNVLLEAGEAALPIVGSVVGGIADFLTPETGWPVPSQQPEDFAAALEYVLQHPEEAASKGQRARTLVHEQHSEEAFWKNLCRLYSFSN